MIHLYPSGENIFWTFISIIFVAYSLRALRIFRGALHGVQAEMPEGKRKKVAEDLASDYCVGEYLRLAQHVLSLILGLTALLVPPAHVVVHGFRLFFGDEFLFVIIAVNVLSGCNSIRAVRSWNRREAIIFDLTGARRPRRYRQTVLDRLEHYHINETKEGTQDQ